MARWTSLLVGVLACGEAREQAPPSAPPAPPPTPPSRVEQTIAAQLGARLGRAVVVTCRGETCSANLGDAVLPISLAKSGEWSIDGLLVRAAPIEAYLRDALVDLGAPQRVACGPAIRSVAPGARIECTLERGGKAFAVIAANGSFSTEIDLDPAAAAARSTEIALPSGGGSGSGNATLEHGEADD